ncbi:hypothetical protein [Daejeonella sp.]|uniref:hypothetical protein n=1 Tax=Daejeonella sp. TaxID=2805397 RepID=UPI00273017A9|nr:hypothetical protein [Daejeonella sp.]MDP2415486.1 hypothetical protein [Daejeonella sp.]
MTPSGKSLFFFGIYVFSTGLLFILLPEKLIDLTLLPPIPSAWARFIGLLALVIGSYDILSGLANIKPFIKISVYIRFGFTLGAILLFVSGQMPVSIILLGGMDALGALWTIIALKSESAKD